MMDSKLYVSIAGMTNESIFSISWVLYDYKYHMKSKLPNFLKFFPLSEVSISLTQDPSSPQSATIFAIWNRKGFNAAAKPVAPKSTVALTEPYQSFKWITQFKCMW